MSKTTTQKGAIEMTVAELAQRVALLTALGTPGQAAEGARFSLA